MAQLVVSAAFAATAFVMSGGNPAAAQWGWMAGSMLSGAMGIGQQSVQGPRLGDLSVQMSTYGGGIPVLYGTHRVAGNVIWASDLIEHAHEEGGKGGGPEVTTYTYTANCAVALCAGEIFGVRRIWADGKLIYDRTAGATITGAGSNIRVYTGSATQSADPLIQSYVGINDTPAYRGTAYVVFDGFDVSPYGNRIPNLSFEVIGVGAGATAGVTAYGSGMQAIIDPATGYLWTAQTYGGGARVEVYDLAAGTLIKRIDSTLITSAGSLDINTGARIVWVAGDGTIGYGGVKQALQIAADSYAVIDSFNVWTSAFYWVGPTVYCPATLAPTQWFFCRNGLSVNCVILDADTGVQVGGVEQTNWVFNAHYIEPTWGGAPFVVATGYGYWMDIYDAFTMTKVATVYPSGWSGTAVAANYSLDADRHIIWWSTPGQPGINAVHLDDYSVTYHLSGVTVKSVVYVAGVLYVQDGSNVWKTYDADSFAALETVGTFANVMSGGTNGLHIANLERILYADASYGTQAIPMVSRISTSTVSLGDVVTDLCARGGLAGGDLDVTSLTDAVNGVVFANPATIRANIETLAVGYFFDAVESDSKIKFVKRGGAVAVTIPSDDLAAHAFGADVPALLDVPRLDETELPREVTVAYADIALDYQTGTQYARRLTGSSHNNAALQLPLALSATEAKRIADARLYNAWAERETASFATCRKYSKYEPTDVVSITVDGVARRLRIVDKTEDGGGIIQWQAVTETAEAYSQTSMGADGAFTAQALSVLGATRLELLDVPILLDSEDASAGFYMAACGYASGWPGCVVYRSVDGGVTWANFTTITAAATIGASQTVLGDFGGGNVFDESSSVTVVLSPGQTLASVSESLVLAGENAAVLGDEIIGYKNATLVSTGIYTLTGLLRGRAGTEWAMGTHTVGERFVRMTTATVSRAETGSSELNLERKYKAVTFGDTLSSASPLNFTNAGVCLKPYAPVLVGAGANAAGDITLTWTRRNRTRGAWRDYSDVPNTEASEAYEVEVYSDGTYTTLKRTVTGITSPNYTYTAAMQVADFGASQTTLHLKIYQMSLIAGRGNSCVAVITITAPALPSSAKWRINVSANNGDPNIAIATLEMHATNGGADICTGGTAVASSVLNYGAQAPQAFDNDTSTCWISNAAPTSSWLEYDFASSVTITEYLITAHQTAGVAAPATWDFQYYDGSTWVTVDSHSGVTWSNGQTRTYSF